MQKKLVRILSVTMAFALLLTTMILQTSAKSVSDYDAQLSKLEQQSKAKEQEIKALSGQANSQQQLIDAIDAKISLVQQQIALCNREIDKIKSTIAENNAQIDKKNQEIKQDQLSFKKRIRAISMSSSNSNVQLLLGADNFSQYLQLSKLTEAVSAHDKLMIEKIVAALKVLEEKQKENNVLLEEQSAKLQQNEQKQEELRKDISQRQSVLNSINTEIGQKEDQNKVIEAEKAKVEKQKQVHLAEVAASNSGQNLIYDGGVFTWPAPGIGRITSGFGSRWGTNHNGIDISNGSFGSRVVAIADGYVYRMYDSCTHNYGKSGNCCGNGYGNYVAVDHGSLNGTSYKAYYAHMSNVIVANGAFVKKGQTLGYIGSTGWSTGAHLHFGLMVNNSWVNPMNYFRVIS